MSSSLAGWLQVALLVAALAACYVPVGNYMAHIFTTDKHWRVERGIYKVIGIDPKADQKWSAYLRSMLAFSAVSVLFLYGLERLQHYLLLSLGMASLLRARVRGFRQCGENIRRLAGPAALLPGLGEHLAQRSPESQCPVSRRQDRGAHAAAGGVAEQVSAGLGGLPVPVGQRDELLAAVGADADHDQQAQLVLLQADVDVDAVGPQVHVVGAGQVPGGERALLRLPGLGQ